MRLGLLSLSFCIVNVPAQFLDDHRGRLVAVQQHVDGQRVHARQLGLHHSVGQPLLLVIQGGIGRAGRRRGLVVVVVGTQRGDLALDLVHAGLGGDPRAGILRARRVHFISGQGIAQHVQQPVRAVPILVAIEKAQLAQRLGHFIKGLAIRREHPGDAARAQAEVLRVDTLLPRLITVQAAQGGNRLLQLHFGVGVILVALLFPGHALFDGVALCLERLNLGGLRLLPGGNGRGSVVLRHRRQRLPRGRQLVIGGQLLLLLVGLHATFERGHLLVHGRGKLDGILGLSLRFADVGIVHQAQAWRLVPGEGDGIVQLHGGIDLERPHALLVRVVDDRIVRLGLRHHAGNLWLEWHHA